jgi:hypothetical protein
MRDDTEPGRITTWERPDGSLAVIAWPPIPCGGCRQLRGYLVNRLGRTVCLECEARAKLAMGVLQ